MIGEVGEEEVLHAVEAGLAIDDVAGGKHGTVSERLPGYGLVSQAHGLSWEPEENLVNTDDAACPDDMDSVVRHVECACQAQRGS